LTAPSFPHRLTVAGAVALQFAAAGTATVRAEEFFPARDQNELLRGFYLPLPSDTRLDAGATFSATLLITNTLNVEQRRRESLLVDGESDALDLTFDHALSSSWRYRFTLPLIHDSGGFLDSVIDAWHEVLGLSRGERPYYPKGRIDYFYSGPANSGRISIDLNHTETSIGDLAGDLGWYAVDTARITVSLWGGLKGPTGSVADLTSDGAWDGSLWAHAALRGPLWRFAAEAGVVEPFGDELFAGAAHRSCVFVRGAATRDVGPAWSLRVQLDAQTGHVAGSELRYLGPSLQLSVGAARSLGAKWRIEMGFAEDAAVDTAPDITFFVGIHD
jgi:hypothetical protein